MKHHLQVWVLWQGRESGQGLRKGVVSKEYAWSGQGVRGEQGRGGDRGVDQDKRYDLYSKRGLTERIIGRQESDKTRRGSIDKFK